MKWPTRKIPQFEYLLLRLPAEQRSRCTLISEAGYSWKVGPNGQPVIWEKGMKTLASVLAGVSTARLSS